MNVTCAECAGELDITEAHGPDSAGDFHCTDLEACDARFLALLEDVRCICGPDETGEAPDCRTDCPVHGTDAPYDPASDIGEVPF